MDSDTDKVCVRAHMITLLKAGINVVARSFDAKSRDIMVTGMYYMLPQSNFPILALYLLLLFG